MPERDSQARPSGGDAGWYLAIGITAAAIRLAFAWQYTSQPLGQYPWVDEASYWSWAQAILKGGWWPIRPFYQDPLYPYWLACLMGVAGTEVARLRLVSAGLGAFTPLVIAWAGRTGLGRTEGILAGWAAALYGPLIFADGSLGKEGFATFWTALALGLTAYMARRAHWRTAGAAGSAWGLVGLLRSNALLIPAVGAVWLLLGGAGGNEDREHGGRFRLTAVFLAGFGLVVVPVIAVNTAVSHPREILGTTWQVGPNFYIGNGPEATGTYAAPAFVRANPAYEAADYAAEAIRRSGHTLSPGQISRFWLGESLKQWTRDPLRSLRLLAWKFALITHRFEIPDNQDLEFVRITAAPALRWGIVDFGVLLPLAAVGLGRKPRTGFWWFLTLAMAAGLAGTAAFFVVGRYRVPWVPALALLGAAGVVDLVGCWKRRDGKGIAWRLVALGLPATLIAWRPQPDPTPLRWGNGLIATGLADLRAGRLDPAIDAFDLARAFDQRTADQIQSILSTDPIHGLMAKRIAANRSAVVADGSSVEGVIGRCRLLRQLPEHREEARHELERILVSQPDHPGALCQLGAYRLSWRDQPGDRARAVADLAMAARGEPSNPTAALLIALASADPGYLNSQRFSPASHDPQVTLVRAMLASRKEWESKR